ncbi:MAG: type II toxin-antitoxin system VapC family toxin [Pseudolysinimonas sp.]|uniref:type II toxin-antitoxin system VapC family toxin n=1 Tax=Pseudolysinimonas sp. TaxID=2680009 RepID=UPI003C70DEB7
MGVAGAVVDASIIVEATVGRGGARFTARAALRQPLAAPELLDLEVASALRRAVHQRRLEIGEADAAIRGLTALPRLARFPHVPLLPRVWALRDNISTYDASYVALAEALGIPLVTADRRLARAAEPYCAVVFVE